MRKPLTIILIILALSVLGIKTGTSQPITIDYYAPSVNGDQRVPYSYEYVGQSFTVTNAVVLDSIKLKMNKTGSPTGNAYCYITAHTGIYGTSSLPTGSVLATSDAFNVATLSGSIAIKKFTFTGANAITLSASTYYCFYFGYSGGNSTNYIAAWVRTSGASHSGNEIFRAAGVWQYITYDLWFYAYGHAAPAVSNKNIFMGINF